MRPRIKTVPYGLAYNHPVERRWTSFEKRVTDKEFEAIPEDDRISLFEAMKLYARDVGKGYVIKELRGRADDDKGQRGTRTVPVLRNDGGFGETAVSCPPCLQEGDS